MTIALSMIVKNEAPVIARCLASVRPLIDYWLIVDTGSTDGTQDLVREILHDVPGMLYERRWHDFATNRNEALDGNDEVQPLTVGFEKRRHVRRKARAVRGLAEGMKATAIESDRSELPPLCCHRRIFDHIDTAYFIDGQPDAVHSPLDAHAAVNQKPAIDVSAAVRRGNGGILFE